MLRVGLAIVWTCSVGCDRVFGVAFEDNPVPADVSFEAATRICFSDDFTGTTLNERWYVGDPEHPDVQIRQNDAIELFTPFGASAPAVNALGSSQLYDLTGGWVEAELVEPPSASRGTNISLNASGKDYYLLSLRFDSAGLLVTYYVNETLFGTPYVWEPAHRYFRFRHQEQSVVFETSSDRITWVNTFATTATVPVDALAISIVGYTILSPTGTITEATMRWDNVRTKTFDCDP